MNGTVGNHSGSPVPDSGNGSLPQCRHAAAVVGNDPGLFDAVLPFVHHGLRDGDLILLACSAEAAELLRAELGSVAGRIEFDGLLNVSEIRPPDAFTRLRDHVRRARDTGSGRLRMLAEAAPGTDPLNWREEMRAEAVFNHVMADLPVSALCFYDTRRLPDDVVASAELTHTHLLSAGGWAANPTYRSATAFVRGLPVPRSPEDDAEPVFAIDDAPTLSELRHQLGAVLARYVSDRDVREDLHLGLSEVAANAFRHGTPPVSARLWVGGGRIVCAISDAGMDFDDPLAGFVPAHGYDLSRGGMGLWLARKLWDHVDLLTGRHGFTVRLDATIPRTSPPTVTR